MVLIEGAFFNRPPYVNSNGTEYGLEEALEQIEEDYSNVSQNVIDHARGFEKWGPYDSYDNTDYTIEPPWPMEAGGSGRWITKCTGLYRTANYAPVGVSCRESHREGAEYGIGIGDYSGWECELPIAQPNSGQVNTAFTYRDIPCPGEASTITTEKNETEIQLMNDIRLSPDGNPRVRTNGVGGQAERDLQGNIYQERCYENGGVATGSGKDASGLSMREYMEAIELERFHHNQHGVLGTYNQHTSACTDHMLYPSYMVPNTCRPCTDYDRLFENNRTDDTPLSFGTPPAPPIQNYFSQILPESCDVTTEQINRNPSGMERVNMISSDQREDCLSNYIYSDIGPACRYAPSNFAYGCYNDQETGECLIPELDDTRWPKLCCLDEGGSSVESLSTHCNYDNCMVLKQIADEAYDTWMSSVPRQIGDANHPEYMASISELVTGVEQGDDYQEEPLASHTTINSCQLIPARCHEFAGIDCLEDSIYESNVQEIDEMAHSIIEGQLLSYDPVTDCCFSEASQIQRFINISNEYKCVWDNTTEAVNTIEQLWTDTDTSDIEESTKSTIANEYLTGIYSLKLKEHLCGNQAFINEYPILQTPFCENRTSEEQQEIIDAGLNPPGIGYSYVSPENENNPVYWFESESGASPPYNGSALSKQVYYYNNPDDPYYTNTNTNTNTEVYCNSVLPIDEWTSTSQPQLSGLSEEYSASQTNSEKQRILNRTCRILNDKENSAWIPEAMCYSYNGRTYSVTDQSGEEVVNYNICFGVRHDCCKDVDNDNTPVPDPLNKGILPASFNDNYDWNLDYSDYRSRCHGQRAESVCNSENAIGLPQPSGFYEGWTCTGDNRAMGDSGVTYPTIVSPDYHSGCPSNILGPPFDVIQYNPAASSSPSVEQRSYCGASIKNSVWNNYDNSEILDLEDASSIERYITGEMEPPENFEYAQGEVMMPSDSSRRDWQCTYTDPSDPFQRDWSKRFDPDSFCDKIATINVYGVGNINVCSDESWQNECCS